MNYLCENWEWAFPKVEIFLRGNYGFSSGSGQRGSGPFSYQSYVHSLLDSDTWGDIIVLYTISWMWGITATILDLPSLSEQRIRHNLELGAVDVVVLLSDVHYSAVGKFEKMTFKLQSISFLD